MIYMYIYVYVFYMFRSIIYILMILDLMLDILGSDVER